jgi:hypothetical protein
MIKKQGELTEEEVNFVAHAAMELALSPEQIKEIQFVLTSGGDYSSFIKEISSKPMRAFLFRRVVAASLLDNKLEDSELALITQTAKAFSYQEKAVSEYLAWMKEGVAWEQRGANLLEKLVAP